MLIKNHNGESVNLKDCAFLSITRDIKGTANIDCMYLSETEKVLRKASIEKFPELSYDLMFSLLDEEEIVCAEIIHENRYTYTIVNTSLLTGISLQDGVLYVMFTSGENSVIRPLGSFNKKYMLYYISRLLRSGVDLSGHQVWEEAMKIK